MCHHDPFPPSVALVVVVGDDGFFILLKRRFLPSEIKPQIVRPVLIDHLPDPGLPILEEFDRLRSTRLMRRRVQAVDPRKGRVFRIVTFL